MVSLHDGRVTGLDGREIFVLHIHILTQFAVRRGSEQAVQDVFHLGISLECLVIYSQHLAVMSVLVGLVEDAQHLHQSVVHTAVKQRNLYDDAVVYETLHKRVGHPCGHLHSVIVVRLVLYIKHGLLDVAHAMSEQIDGYHRYAPTIGVIILDDVVGIGILRTEVLAETQRLRLQPCLLQFYEHQFQASVVLAHLGSEVDAEHRDLVTRTVGVFMLPHIHFGHLLFQQGRKYGLGHAVVLHQVFEHRIINRVCNTYYHNQFLFYVGANIGN